MRKAFVCMKTCKTSDAHNAINLSKFGPAGAYKRSSMASIKTYDKVGDILDQGMVAKCEVKTTEMVKCHLIYEAPCSRGSLCSASKTAVPIGVLESRI